MLNQKKQIVVCTEYADPSWRWIESRVTELGLHFEIVRCVPKGHFRWFKNFNIARLSGCLKAVRISKNNEALALFAHGPTLAAWTAIFAFFFRLKIPIVAYAFNFSALPTFLKRIVFSLAFKRVHSFVVYSQMERDLYSTLFGLPKDRFEFIFWGVRPPDVDYACDSLVRGDYVSAIGGNARDYRTLLEAAAQTPAVQYVLVVRPQNLTGLHIPKNVTVYENLPLNVTMNILAHSRFMMLPLLDDTVPCGHVTLVAAMHLSKAVIVTNSIGVADYVRHKHNAILTAVGEPAPLALAVLNLWTDPTYCNFLGENGRRFAANYCSEERTVEHFRSWINLNLGINYEK